LTAPLLLMFLVPTCTGHGYLAKPPARNSMWRFGFSNPVNYNDNELFCGGFGVQWDVNQGKCGVCGDDYRDEMPREHETGGKYGNKIISATYTAGDTVDIEVEIVANHWGYFELKLCPMDELGEIVSQDCLDQRPLEVMKTPAMIRETARVVANLTCEAVVGRSAPGMNQWCETTCLANLYECPLNICKCNAQILEEGFLPSQVLTTKPTTQSTTQTTKTTPTSTEKPLKTKVCQATGIYETVPGMHEFCQLNCLRLINPNCPPSICTCTYIIIESSSSSITSSTTDTTTTISFSGTTTTTSSSTTSSTSPATPSTTPSAATTTSTTATTHASTSTSTTASTTVSTAIVDPITVPVDELTKEKYKFRIPKSDQRPQLFKYQVRLPHGVTCERCVLQWTYVTGNSWGFCEDGTGAVGCGIQEWFRNCADIAIKTTEEIKQSPARNTVYNENNERMSEPLVVDAIVCIARNESTRTAEDDDECMRSCFQYPPQCDLTSCKCLSWCEAIGDLAGIEGTDTFCNMNCLRYPPTCPADKCLCHE